MAVKRKGLGKGLDSLIPENKSVKPAAKAEKEESVKTGEQMLKINQVEPNREQPRKHFEEDALLELADSIKQELIKEVIVPCYTYQENNREENLVYEDIDVVAGEVETYYIQDPSYGYKVKLDEVEGKAIVVAWSNYFVTIKFNVTGSFKLEVQGYRYKIVEKYATVSLNARGKTVKWKNPLISNTTMANELAAWLADYYTAGIEYEYDTRGNPELDATDIVYQENEFHDGMRVNIYRHTVNFKQAFSGRVTARRIGG